jgi:predicted ATPase with chaperone activity
MPVRSSPVYDPIVHTKVEGADGAGACAEVHPRHDTRYVLCERPTVITGGEVDARCSTSSTTPPRAPTRRRLQLKSTGGVFIVDDLGRQEEPPQALVNRWIVPLEKRKDILALQSGEKFEVPFDTLVIFSTNFHPNEIFDQAALRRIFFKIKIDGPNQRTSSRSSPWSRKKRKMPLTRTR